MSEITSSQRIDELLATLEKRANATNNFITEELENFATSEEPVASANNNAPETEVANVNTTPNIDKNINETSSDNPDLVKIAQQMEDQGRIMARGFYAELIKLAALEAYQFNKNAALINNNIIEDDINEQEKSVDYILNKLHKNIFQEEQ